MSRLRELRLHGFKTFAEPTRFVFEPGVNAVIGPNGSGKSNMADAVRWVLGEQSNRSLRTRRADDVIFAGSQQRKPTGLAEVVMTLDNADGWLPIDFAEVTIGRRAYRSGEAEYLINGARVRLREIVDMLGAGQLGASSLVIVGQGTVDAALSLRPEERRQLFEEAAGVKNLQVRKNEALGRLARAEDNLTRVNDLVTELRPQVRRLALQAEHQQEHDTLGGRARALVQEGHRRRERTLREALGDARRREAAALSAAETLRSEIAAGRDAIAGAETRYWDAEQAARDAAHASEAAREGLIRLESRRDAIVARLGDTEERLEASRTELASLADERRDAASAGGDADERAQAALDDATEAAAAAQRAWQAAVETLAAADSELLAAEEALAEARARDAEALSEEARLRDAAVERMAKSERIDQEIRAVSSAREQAEALAARARTEADRGRGEAETAAAALAEARAASEASRRRADEARMRATATAERLAAAQAELEAIVERTERSSGIGERLTASGWRSLVDAVSAPEAAWPAVEAVIGGEVSEAFLWREADPGSATTDASGTVRLLDGRRPPDAAERRRALVAVGARQTLAEWIGGDEIPGIFARVAVAPELEALLAGWRDLPAGWSAVTAEGDLADGRGLVALRGRADPPGGAATRQVVRRRHVAEELKNLEPAYSEAADAAASAVAEAAASERLRARAQQIFDAADLEARRLAAQAAEAVLAMERIVADTERLNAERTALGSLPAQGADMLRPSAERFTDRESREVRATTARERRSAAARTREDAREKWLAARRHADEVESSVMGSRRLIAEVAVRRESLERAMREAVGDLQVLATERQALDAQVAEARSTEEQSAARRGDADAQRERLRAELLALERQESGASGQLAELDRAHQSAALEVARHDDALVALAREREIALDALGLEGAPGESQDEGSPSGAQADDADLAAEIAALDTQEVDAELRRIRRLLSQIGSVNPFAVEEHREHAARLESLSTQEADLRSAIEATRELITRLDGEINQRFGVAFRAIGTAFDEFVQLLFAGGSASLEQVEGDEDGTGGIEIVVRPPGKRPQRLAMLSGGERALTGVALLFAMLSVNPVPFCILDEVDAALDEANIGRFAAALRKLADRIDFVVITHNRATIEVADTIYGVTMTDAAVSRVVSLRLTDLPVEATA